jgi:hypothetical protein
MAHQLDCSQWRAVDAPGSPAEAGHRGKMFHAIFCKMSVKDKTGKFYSVSWEMLKDLQRTCKNVE